MIVRKVATLVLVSMSFGLAASDARAQLTEIYCKSLREACAASTGAPACVKAMESHEHIYANMIKSGSVPSAQQCVSLKAPPTLPQAPAKFAPPAGGGPDVNGVTLGMPAEQALAVVRAQNNAYRIQPLEMSLKDKFGQLSRTYQYGISATIPSALPGASLDQTMISLADPDGRGQPVAIMVNRSLAFTADKQPLAESLLQMLRSKYGAETDFAFQDSLKQRRFVLWAFDANGKLVPPGGAISLKSCTSGFNFGVAAFESGNNQLYVRARDQSSYDWMSKNAGCGTTVFADIYGMELAARVEIRLVNLRYYTQAIEWLRADLQAATSATEQQQLNRAKDNAVPKL